MMMEAHEAPHDERARFAEARAEFVASLARRLSAIRSAVQAAEDQPESGSRRDNLHRRLHAMAAAARVLGFDAMAKALARAEHTLQPPSADAVVATTALAEVSRVLDRVPALVWGSPRPTPLPKAAPDAPRASAARAPLSALVFGAPPLAEVLSAAHDARIDCERSEDPAQARELARVLGPDVVIVDIDRHGGRELLDAMTHDPLVDPVPIIVVGTFEAAEAATAFVALGAARVLPKPVSPDTLCRAAVEISHRGAPARDTLAPIGRVNVAALSERIAREVQRGLVEALEPGADIDSVELGQGAEVLGAVWGAVARVRELVTLRSGGKIRFDPRGPEGAIPLAPWLGGQREAPRQPGTQRDVEAVTLAGRTLVVADDDPAVVWFISGLLRAVGAHVLEAHDGRSALELTHAHWPDVVVSDVLMPELDGFALCHQIKRDVAVRDVPLILLSWKEDLLQRLRELGADADGYLRKEASASQVVQRVREVLRPRARVEARIAAGGTVRGRLEGLTPRLILELACAKREQARVTFRDAMFLYEVECRDGAPRAATRTASDGSYQRGALALAALLGVSAGRFIITDSHAPYRIEFTGSLKDVLSGAIARARMAQNALAPNNLPSVERVELDDAALADYLIATPEPAKHLVSQLIDGIAPRTLMLRGASPQLLDSVLSDVARRGGVRRILHRDGSALDLMQLSMPPPADDAPAAAPAVATPEPPPLFTFQLSPAAPEAAVDPGVWEQLDAPARDLEHSPLPLNRQTTPALITHISDTWQNDVNTLPGMGQPPHVAATEQRIPDETDAALELGAAVADTITQLSPAPVPPQAFPAATPSPSAATPAPPATEPPRPEPNPLAAAEMRVEIIEEDEIHDVPDTPAAGEIHDASDAPAAGEIHEALQANAALEREAHDQVRDELEPNNQVRDELEPNNESGLRREARVEQPLEANTPDYAAVLESETLAESAAPALPPQKDIAFPLAGRSRASAKSSKAEQQASSPSKTQTSTSALRITLLVGAAFLVTFAATTWLRSLDRTARVPAAKSQRAATAPPASATASPQASSSAVEAIDTSLPPGIAIAPTKGLLEVDTGGSQAIFVDGVFVGRGPLRRIPLSPGTHKVQIKQDGRQRLDRVQITRGRRTRLALAPLWK